jgi:hypothetical protein
MIIVKTMIPDPLNSPAFLPIVAHDRHAQATADSLRVELALTENTPPSKKMHGFDNNISALLPLCHSNNRRDLNCPDANHWAT